MLSRSISYAFGVVAGMLIASAANAATGVSTGAVNLRTCGSTQCAKITTIPAGAEVWVYNCDGWCELDYAGHHGFASASYIAVGAQPPVVAPTPLPPAVYWRYGRPVWDRRYRAWYDRHGWWYGGGWHGRPPRGGFTFEFHF